MYVFFPLPSRLIIIKDNVISRCLNNYKWLSNTLPWRRNVVAMEMLINALRHLNNLVLTSFLLFWPWINVASTSKWNVGTTSCFHVLSTFQLQVNHDISDTLEFDVETVLIDTTSMYLLCNVVGATLIVPPSAYFS